MELVIPDSVEEIGNRAFDSMYLKTIYIGSGVKKIGMWAFGFVTDFAGTVTDAYGRPFVECDTSTIVHYNGTKKKWRKIEIVGSNSNILNATIICTDGTIE